MEYRSYTPYKPNAAIVAITHGRVVFFHHSDSSEIRSIRAIPLIHMRCLRTKVLPEQSRYELKLLAGDTDDESNRVDQMCNDVVARIKVIHSQSSEQEKL